MARWIVTVNQSDPTKGVLSGPSLTVDVALGKNGTIAAADKREGDGKTPLGTYPMRRVFYRPDKVVAPKCALPVAPLSPSLGWCDDPAHAAYNHLVQLPFSGSHEKMWREDTLYNLVLVIGHNDDPPMPGLGSAIFIHCAKEGLKPTEGCVAMPEPAMLNFLRALNSGDLITLG